MDWLHLGLGVASIGTVPIIWSIAYLRRRRGRAFIRHDTTPPTPDVTTGQLQ